MSKKLTNEEFRQKLYQNNPKTKTNDLYNGYRSRMNFYCDLGHVWDELAGNALAGYGCPYCSNKRVLAGFNDIWTTDPDVARLLSNPQDGYMYTRGSEVKLDFICKNCGFVSKHTVNNAIKYGASCPKCSDGISFANKFMFNMLEQLHIDFECEYSMVGQDYRYDFFLKTYNMIIEMHGKQHYEGWNDKRSLDEIKRIDKEKMIYAKSSGISSYIVINSSKSDMSYISDNIIRSQLSELFDLSIIDWRQCLFYASSSMVNHAAKLYNEGYTNTEISKKLHVSMTTVWKWLKIAGELNLCNYCPVNKFIDSTKQVVCTTTLEIFESITKASQKYNISVTNISKVCKHKKHSHHAGKHPVTGKRLSWMYLDEYLSLHGELAIYKNN